jgi:hypothetical protein
MEFKRRTLVQLAGMICGNKPQKGESYFKYRSSSYITEFFEECETDFVHDGSTRQSWVAETLEKILKEPHPSATAPPEAFSRVILNLMDQEDIENDEPMRPKALAKLNSALVREGFEAFYAPDKKCYLRHVETQTVAAAGPNPHRPLSAEELERKESLVQWLAKCSEDELIEEILLPLFRFLGFQRITPAGHKDKALEYGKDVWMRFMLPTRHYLYFGLQVKKGKIDASGKTAAQNGNVAEILNQVTMMLGHEIFDPDTNKRALVDHAFIVSAGEMTKQARNWLGQRLDASKRSQVMFIDRDYLVDLFIVSNVPLPKDAATVIDEFDDDKQERSHIGG